jgi:hypothetical protein
MHENAHKNRLFSSAAAIEQQHTPKAVEQSVQQKLAHTIPQAVQASGLSRSMLYLATSGAANLRRSTIWPNARANGTAKNELTRG